VLGATERITVGTTISIPSAQHPVTLSEQTALFDHLSAGRFQLGVGRGGPWMDLELFQTGLDRYDRALAESLDLLQAWLTGARVQADGELFRFREVAVVPRPVTRPHPPILVACTSETTLDLAAARGLPVLIGMHIGDDEKRRLVQRWAAVAERNGHDPTAAPKAAITGVPIAVSHGELRRTSPTSTVATTQAR
jgi:alkanesulfonate monooxygenase SsuD/methylene tetrahydromethanopterin reductase-like flavin-dependent oxidoreductase (luciferase family)